ncbi:MAG: type II toxin-antitoxin system prevent-host-death family antitoxin [Anaerolinea sp.]|nr:type II toxin-antitoxin system prevent-host-death family antitoxin [Anaerolinea sp.]
MPTVVNIHEAKTHLSRLLEAVERGEEVVIARAGHPIATLSAYKAPRRKIGPPGSMEGEGWWMADDFDAPIDDLFDCLKDDDEEEALDTPAAG